MRACEPLRHRQVKLCERTERRITAQSLSHKAASGARHKACLRRFFSLDTRLYTALARLCDTDRCNFARGQNAAGSGMGIQFLCIFHYMHISLSLIVVLLRRSIVSSRSPQKNFHCFFFFNREFFTKNY